MTAPLQLVGRKFTRLTVIERADSSLLGQAQWKCVCDCGNVLIVAGKHLISGKTLSCKCLSKEKARKRGKANITHGLTKSPTYSCWRSMMQRCYVPKAAGYVRYGGSGISVCESWHKFENFLTDMGLRPTLGHTVDRKNGNENYCLENCRWATKTEQSRNRRKIKKTSSQYKGAVWDYNKWKSSIMVDGKVIRLGRFDSELKAHEAYCEAALKYHGEFACLK